MMSSPPSTSLLPSATAASLLPHSVSRRLCFAGAGGPATARRRGGSRLAVVRASSGGDLEVPIEEGIASDVLTKQTTVQDTGAASNLVETIQGAGFKLQTLHAEKTNPFLADWIARLSFSAGYSTARYALSSTDYTDSAKDLIHAANRQEHDLMRSIFHLQEVAFSCTWKAGLLGSFISYVLPPSCLAEPCEQDYSLPNMPLLFAIAMVGATVGGLLARQRRGELKRLNDQLRQINAALRRQAKIESYAPTLSYAPVGSKIQESDVIVDPQKERLIVYLRSGKNHLRNQAPDKAFPEFKAALDLAQSLSDHVEEKKAARGLGASLQRQGKYKEAIKYHSMVLNISKMTGEDSGVTEAYGAIADCYTELGELEKAGEFYDKYISRLQND